MNKKSLREAKTFGICPNCQNIRELRLSHAIPKAAYKPLLEAGRGQAIGIPGREGNAHLTSETGDAPLLCDECEGEFNRRFDGPATNALKRLENEILRNGIDARIDFSSDQLAHAVVSIAWRICLSPSQVFREVKPSRSHLNQLTNVLRLPSSEVLKHCSVRLGRLASISDKSADRFRNEKVGQLIKTPDIFSIKVKRYGKLDRFALDWTMFGFLVHCVVPRIPYPRSKSFKGLKRNSNQIWATEVDMLDYPPLRDALAAGYAASAEGRMSPALKRRSAKDEKSD